MFQKMYEQKLKDDQDFRENDQLQKNQNSQCMCDQRAHDEIEKKTIQLEIQQVYEEIIQLE
jgi:hypothetical protein